MQGERVFESGKLGRWAYVLRWSMVGGVSRPVAVWLRSLDEPPRPVTRRVLAAVESFEGAQRAASMKAEAARLANTDLGQWLEALPPLFEELAALQERRKPGQRPLSDEHLRRVADVYTTAERVARDAGKRPRPRKAVADAFGKTEATASKYIARARSTTDPATGRPFLAPSKGRED
jgi:hypothetical protein